MWQIRNAGRLINLLVLKYSAKLRMLLGTIKIEEVKWEKRKVKWNVQFLLIQLIRTTAVQNRTLII